MKRFFFLFAILLALVMVAPAHAEIHHYVAKVYKQLYDKPGNLTEITSGITYKVLAVNSDTAETLGSDEIMTSKTNPVTATVFNTQDRVDFYCDPTDATNDLAVDLIVVDSTGGFTAFVEDFDPYTRSIVIDERPNIVHHGMIWFAASDNSETDTGVDFSYDTFVHDAWVEVVTVDATETIDVGLLSTETAGDANGLRAAVSVATAGFPTDTAVITGGSNIDYTPATTYGALLVTAITGSDAVATNGGKSYIGHIVTGANAQSITYTGSAGSDTAAGYIHYFFTRMR